MRGDPYLPPGVSQNMIPGSRPEDFAEEEFWEKLAEELQNRFKLDVEDEFWQADWFVNAITVARDLGYTRGHNEGQADAEIALAMKQEAEAEAALAESQDS